MTPKVNITQAAQRISVSVNGAGEVNVAVTPPPDVVVQVSQGAVSVTYVGGDVFGPASSTNNALAVFDGTDGKLLRNGTLTNPAANQLGGVSTVTAQGSGGIVVEASNGTDIGMLGAGNTANATWYGSHNFNAVTADRIAGFGGSKTLQSLDTATYPSLTELSYVKGVTSGIQVQLNAKGNVSDGDTLTLGLTFPSSGIALETEGAGLFRILYNGAEASDVEVNFNLSGSSRSLTMIGDLDVEGSTSVNGIFRGRLLQGSGNPEGVVTAPVGSLYTRTDGTPGNTLYVKESGAGNTGWAAK